MAAGVQSGIARLVFKARKPHGFARIRCDACAAERLVAFSCKGRGACPSCNARRMVEVAAHLTDQVLPPLPVRQWVLSLPKRIRPFLPHDPRLAGDVLRVLLRGIRTTLRRASPPAPGDAQLGAVSLACLFVLPDKLTIQSTDFAGSRAAHADCAQVGEHSSRWSADPASLFRYLAAAHRLGEHDQRGLALECTGWGEQTVEPGGPRCPGHAATYFVVLAREDVVGQLEHLLYVRFCEVQHYQLVGSGTTYTAPHLERRDFNGFVMAEEFGPRSSLAEGGVPNARVPLLMVAAFRHRRISEIEEGAPRVPRVVNLAIESAARRRAERIQRAA
jgi:hypothetical protein